MGSVIRPRLKEKGERKANIQFYCLSGLVFEPLGAVRWRAWSWVCLSGHHEPVKGKDRLYASCGWERSHRVGLLRMKGVRFTRKIQLVIESLRVEGTKFADPEIFPSKQ